MQTRLLAPVGHVVTAAPHPCQTGACVCFLMASVAASEFSRHIRRLTPFTHDIFACFVCSIYVYDGATDLIARFRGSDAAPTFGEALSEANLAAVVLGVCLVLHRARCWTVLPKAVRGFVADYAVTLAVLASAGLAGAMRNSVTIQLISLPNSSHVSPTCATGGNGDRQRARDAALRCGR